MGYTLVASKLDRWWITGPMVFVAAGTILGPGGLDVLPVSLTNETVVTITELTLALLLFSDASTVRLGDVEGDAGLPRRLLFIGLPLTVLAGALLAYLVFPKVGWAAAALVAAILAPTDAALGLAVVTNKAVPVRIRRALNVESGLNDGIATPLVTLFIAAAAAEESISNKSWGLEALKQIGLAIVAAVVVGYIGGKLLAFANDRGWTSGVSEQIAILALALLAYEGAVAIGGNGFIAGFAGGILFGAATRGRLAKPVQFTETLGLSASFLVWSIFGALFVGGLLTRDLSVQPIVYAILSLTVIRMVPVAIALIGTHLRPATVAFMGWLKRRLPTTNQGETVWAAISLPPVTADANRHPPSRPHPGSPAAASDAAPIAASANRPAAGGGVTATPPSSTASAANATPSSRARARNRRTQPRAVSYGTPARAAAGRTPEAPPAT